MIKVSPKLHAGQRKENMVSTIVKYPSNNSLGGREDESDEYFDLSDSTDESQSENRSPDSHLQDITSPKFSLAVAFLKRLHGLAVQKKGYTVEDIVWQENLLRNSDPSFPNDPTGDLPNSWGTGEPSLFQVRGDNYLKDHKKIMGTGQSMQLVAANWLKSDKQENDLAGRPGSIVQNFVAAGNPDFFFVVNMQIPCATTYYHLSFYYVTSNVEDVPLLKSFVERDDEYRNSRFKLIPHVSKGPWIVKQSVGTRACLLGQVLKIDYVHGKNYIELDIDVGSSTIARKVASTVVGSFNNLIIESAFLIQANTSEELPEHLLGTCRLNHLDVSKARWA